MLWQQIKCLDDACQFLPRFSVANHDIMADIMQDIALMFPGDNDAINMDDWGIRCQECLLNL